MFLGRKKKPTTNKCVADTSEVRYSLCSFIRVILASDVIQQGFNGCGQRKHLGTYHMLGTWSELLVARATHKTGQRE
jgi:hypothetical protein